MPLPFDTDQIDVVDFAAPGVAPFGLPKYDSVTPAEELAIIPVLRAVGEDLSAEVMVCCNQALATIALKRLHPDQAEGDTAQLPLALVKDLAEFLLNERNGWEQPEVAEKKSTGPATTRKSAKSSASSTGDLPPAGPSASAESASATSPSAKSKSPA